MHPGQDQLGAYVEGSLRAKGARAVEAHLAQCFDCRQVAAAASAAWAAAAGGDVPRAGRAGRRQEWEALGAAASLLLVAGLTVWALRPGMAGGAVNPPPRGTIQRTAVVATPVLVHRQAAPQQPPQIWARETMAPPKLPATAVVPAPAPTAAATLDFSTLRTGFQDQQASLSTRQQLASWGGLITAQPASASTLQLTEPGPLAGGSGDAGGVSLLASGFQQAEATAVVPLAPQITASVGWAVSRSGELLRAVAAGIWKSVPLAPGVKVQVFYAAGERVWAGGQANELFASGDGGAHWRQVKLPGVRAAAERLQSITFTGTQTGIITAVNGQMWTTRDGGKTWVPGVY